VGKTPSSRKVARDEVTHQGVSGEHERGACGQGKGTSRQTRQDKTRQGKARQGKARQGKGTSRQTGKLGRRPLSQAWSRLRASCACLCVYVRIVVRK
jgi:hypothetical protein